MDCNKTNLKTGSSGEDVKTIQTLLQKQGYYTGKIDGSFGTYTRQAVVEFQKKNKLLTDGIVGPVTCKRLQGTTNTTVKVDNGIYESIGHFMSTGCNKKGQCTSTFCAPHTIHQIAAKWDLEKYADEYRLAGWAGTTSSGTSHAGIETAFYQLGKVAGVKFKLTWKNLSDFGGTLREQMQNIGKILQDKNKCILWHDLYRLKYGHYEIVKLININTLIMLVLNSLGSKCTSTSFCGYDENRNCSTMASYCKGISQKSILIVEIVR